MKCTGMAMPRSCSMFFPPCPLRCVDDGRLGNVIERHVDEINGATAPVRRIQRTGPA